MKSDRMTSDATRARDRLAGLIRQETDPEVVAAARRGLALANARRAERKCSVDGCERKYRAKGFCATHLIRFNRHGDASVTRGWTRHGLARHPLYPIWHAIIRRCENPADQAYVDYGGRGIRVCERWYDLATFVSDIERWLGPRPPGLTFDRIMNDHDYRLDNVRWATPSEQRRNQRSRKRAREDRLRQELAAQEPG